MQHMRVLVTGDLGFVGQRVMAALPGAVGLSSLGPEIDIGDSAALVKALRMCQPQAVLHLAAQSFVPESFDNPEKTYAINFTGTLRLLQALADTGFKGKFLQVGSGDAYGLVPLAEMPIQETRALKPRSPYSVSKAAAEALCFQWSQTGPFEVVMARPFNHIGAGQSSNFAVPDFARQIAQVAAGLRAPVLRVGNMDVSRDFTDVGDIVHAYELLLQQGVNGECYNVCSGQEFYLRDLVERLIKLAGVDARLEVDPERFRPAEQARIWGSYDKLHKHTGWRPLISMDETLLLIYQFSEREFRV